MPTSVELLELHTAVEVRQSKNLADFCRRIHYGDLDALFEDRCEHAEESARNCRNAGHVKREFMAIVLSDQVCNLLHVSAENMFGRQIAACESHNRATPGLPNLEAAGLVIRDFMEEL